MSFKYIYFMVFAGKASVQVLHFVQLFIVIVLIWLGHLVSWILRIHIAIVMRTVAKHSMLRYLSALKSKFILFLELGVFYTALAESGRYSLRFLDWLLFNNTISSYLQAVLLMVLSYKDLRWSKQPKVIWVLIVHAISSWRQVNPGETVFSWSNLNCPF